jgi:hypothetical protein
MLPYQIFQRYLAFPYPTHSFCLRLLTILLIVRPNAVATNIFTSYANDFVDPTHAAGQYASNLRGAQDTIVAWANEMNSYGPWSKHYSLAFSDCLLISTGVTNKPVVAPSGNKHDYMSWAP